MVCRFCRSHQHVQFIAAQREKIRTVNIETGLPSALDALRRLENEIMRTRQAGVRVVRVIHGWGSTGIGGKLRDACRAFLTREIKAKRIKTMLPGDDYSTATVATRELIARYPDLRKSERSDTNNPGITFVEL